MKFSNRYIFLYISVLVIIVAGTLAIVSLVLRPRQEANRKGETAARILKAAGYGALSTEQAVALFDSVASPITDSQTERYAIVCSDGDTGQVVYVSGKGLWGPIWGYVVLASDNNTIKGVAFSHKSETPGLGAKITEESFADSFSGKKIYNADGEYVSVVLSAKGNSEANAENSVDAISGATITSKGVEKMLYEGLKDAGK
ncbi:MAG: FMN-binding protein [Bacteroidales bacterium]|nr:FMN-binding protein [Bacteroidales bacterium]